MGNSVMEGDAASPEDWGGMYLRRAESSESRLRGAAGIYLFFFLQREWEMDGTAARPSRTSAHILAVWAADELFCCEG